MGLAMISRATRRRTRGALIATGTAAILFAAAAPAMASEGMMWNGFGWSAVSAEYAVSRAIDDVETMAAGERQYNCELIDGSTIIWERFNQQNGSHWWEASVDMICR
ncbi:hypothetical protein [Acrocarpospora sp. B8E8]|uniref:hypothetical protein n=1 Tax=Acrocarpospora sp. B8E8 TaxID=3153572 RepID=UPI00325CCF01